MVNDYYLLKLFDPATPGFCSFDKIYVGTEETIKIVADNLSKLNSDSDTSIAIQSYFNGNISAEHYIAYKKQNVLTPISIEAENKMSFEGMKWTHINIWGFPYEMKCDSANVHQIIFHYDDAYYRCVRVWLKNLCYECFNDNWSKLNGGFWGNGSVLNVTTIPGTNDFIFNNLLFIEEAHYDDKTAAFEDFNKKEKIEFKKICDEIYGDG